MTTLLSVSSRCPPSSGLLELASHGPDERLDVRVGNSGSAEVSLSLTGLAGSLDEEGVLSLRGTGSELVEGDDLSSGLQDTSASALGDAKSGDRDLGKLEDTAVVSHGRGGNNDLVVVSGLLQDTGDASNGERSSVLARHKETLQNDAVELLSSAASEVAVELDQDAEVRILALGGSPADLAVVLVVDIDTHLKLG